MFNLRRSIWSVFFPHFSVSPVFCSETKSAAWGFLRKSTECVCCFQEQSQISALPPPDILSFSKFSHWEVMTLKSNVTKSCIVSKHFKCLTSANHYSVSFCWNDVLWSHKLPQLAAPLIKREYFQFSPTDAPARTEKATGEGNTNIFQPSKAWNITTHNILTNRNASGGWGSPCEMHLLTPKVNEMGFLERKSKKIALK